MALRKKGELFIFASEREGCPEGGGGGGVPAEKSGDYEVQEIMRWPMTCINIPFTNINVKSFQLSVAFHTEISHLISIANRLMTGFYM